MVHRSNTGAQRQLGLPPAQGGPSTTLTTLLVFDTGQIQGLNGSWDYPRLKAAVNASLAPWRRNLTGLLCLADDEATGQVTAAGHGGGSRRRVTATGHGGRSWREVTATGHGGGSRRKVTATGVRSEGDAAGGPTTLEPSKRPIRDHGHGHVHGHGRPL